MTSKAMTKTKHPMKKFERTAGPLPMLKRAAPATAATPAGAGTDADADQPAEAAVPGFLSQKEVLLRLVETLKAL
jgi:hypothetical protein